MWPACCFFLTSTVFSFINWKETDLISKCDKWSKQQIRCCNDWIRQTGNSNRGRGVTIPTSEYVRATMLSVLWVGSIRNSDLLSDWGRKSTPDSVWLGWTSSADIHSYRLIVNGVTKAVLPATSDRFVVDDGMSGQHYAFKLEVSGDCQDHYEWEVECLQRWLERMGRRSHRRHCLFVGQEWLCRVAK